ncbi:MAG: response regulator [Lachnospiraceae bacterium]|nr:response regulator [Lachnospiraceae bacterium]
MQAGKLRVLIADDEFRIAKLIEKLIHWDELRLECVGLVDNGETALEMIQELRPNIVITDIRMPKINGLDLIRMTRDLNLDTKFIVVSGYKEFEYAHRALQYEVDSYLLKPIKETELNDILRRICEKKNRERECIIERKQMEQTVSESEWIIRRDFLKNIIDQEESSVLEDYRIQLEGELYRGIDIKLDYVDYHLVNHKQDRITVERIHEIVKGILKPIAREILICEKEFLHIYCLFNYDATNAIDVNDGINGILSEIQEYLLEFERYEVTIGIGREKQDFGDIRFSIKEAHRAVGSRIKLGTGRLIYADTLPAPKQGKESLKQYSETLFAAFDSYSVKKLEQSIDQIYRVYMEDAALDYSVCYDMVEELLELIFHHIDVDQEDMQKFQKRIMDECQHCFSVSGIKNCLKKELGDYIQASLAAVEAESTKPIRQAKKYIDEHYSEKILLEDIADIVGLNPVYFSVLFKKETDMNFSTYLVTVRMNRAKEMLCNTNETIATIGELVGYRDSRYFSQTFTKVVGVKPALYRRLHS